MPRCRIETADFVDRAPVVIAAERVLAVEAQAAFDVLAETSTWSEWFPMMREASWTSLPPHGDGSTRRIHLGPIRAEERFVVWQPPNRWGFTFLWTNVPFLRAGVELVEFEEVGAGRTRARHRMAFDLPAAIAALQPMLGPVVRESLERGLGALEQRARP